MKHSKAIFTVATVLCVMLLATPGIVLAGPPFVTEDSGTQGKGNVEAEFTFEYQKTDDDVKTKTLGNSFALGIASNVDLSIAYSYDFVSVPDDKTTRGMNDVEVQLKTALNEGKEWVPTFAIKGGVSLPVESGGQTTVLLTGIAQWEFEPFSVFANVGADLGTRLAGNDERTDVIRASVAGSWDVMEMLALVSEITWNKVTNPHREGSAWDWMIGTQWSLNDTMKLSAGARLGLNDNAPDYAVIVGFSWAFQGK